LRRRGREEYLSPRRQDAKEEFGGSELKIPNLRNSDFLLGVLASWREISLISVFAATALVYWH
jgi:hypothetical protein